MQCYTCLNISNERPIFSESRIWEGKFWLVEHVYPVKILGWFVVILKKHAEVFHEIGEEEWLELAKVQSKLTKLLNEELSPEKEYIFSFVDKPHFHHIHFHIVAIPKELPKKFRGVNIFSLLNIDEIESVSKEEIIKLCNKIKPKLDTR